MKSAQDYLAEANAIVPKIETKQGIAKHGQTGVVFVDVRDSAAIKDSGTIAGAVCIPRGFVEFAADPATQFHNPQMDKDAEIILVCGAGGQAALAGRTLIEMGFKHVSNVGGFGAWKDEGGPTQG